MTAYSYEIDKRPEELGGGYHLRLFEDGLEVGGGVFPPADDTEAAELDAHMEANDEGQYWLSTRPASPAQDLARHNDDAREIIRTIIVDGRPQDLRKMAEFLECVPTPQQVRDAYEACDFLTPEFWTWLKGRKADLADCLGMRLTADTEDGRQVAGIIVDFRESGAAILQDDAGRLWHGYMHGHVAPADQPEPVKPPHAWDIMPNWKQSYGRAENR
jgi:hypothetical protein